MGSVDEIIKIAVRPRYSFCIWVTCIAILLLPLPQFLYLAQIRKDYGHFAGLLCLLSFSVWIVELFLLVMERKKFQKEILDNLEALAPEEQLLLARALSKNIRTIIYQEDSDAVLSLSAKHLLEGVPNKTAYRSKPFTIPLLVWKELCSIRDPFIQHAISCNPQYAKELRRPDSTSSESTE